MLFTNFCQYTILKPAKVLHLQKVDYDMLLCYTQYVQWKET